MIEVVPILVPRVDWEALTTHAQSALGRSISVMADRAGIKPNTAAAQVVALESILGDGQTARAMISEAWPSTLAHLQYGFLLQAEYSELQKVALTVSGILNVSSRLSVMIASGSLRDWRDAVKVGLSSKAPLSVRLLFSDIYGFFEQLQLGYLWGKKKSQDDGTLLLES